MTDPDDRPQTLAAALNTLMVEKGWTQRELALQLGVDGSRISRVLTGKEGMAMTRVERLSTLLGMPEEDVAGLIWKARRGPGHKPSTLGERVTALEIEVSDLKATIASAMEDLAAATAAVEKAAGTKAKGRSTTRR